jgi:hypothetical protein
MKTIEVVRYQQQLDNLFDQTKAFSGDPELQSHWAKYLCVLINGFLEVSVRSIYGHYARTKAAPFVANYVEKQLKDFQNPKMGKILDLTKSFNAQWEIDLKIATEGERKDSIDSIVDNKNRIAHGEWVGITYATIKRYYINALSVVELIEQQCEQ